MLWKMCKSRTMGFIKIHRKMLEWEWYGKPEVVTLWLHLLLTANWEDREWRGEVVPRGALITSIAKLSVETGLSVKQIRTALEKLEKGKQIVREGASQWTKIIICKYDTYQSLDFDEGQTNGKQSGKQSAHERATTKEYKNTRNEEKKDANASKEREEAAGRLYALYPSSATRADGNKVTLKSVKDKEKLVRLLATHSEAELANTIKRYLEGKPGAYIRMFATFLNNLPDYSEPEHTAEQPPVLYSFKVKYMYWNTTAWWAVS